MMGPTEPYTPYSLVPSCPFMMGAYTSERMVLTAMET